MEKITAFLQTANWTHWKDLIIACVVAVILVIILLKIEKKIAKKVIQKRENDINAQYGDRVVRFLIVFIAIQVVIMSSDLTKSFGSVLFQGTTVLAAVAGIAARPVLADMICGFIISVTKPFNIGDRIELDDGTSGIVKEITTRHVTLQGIDTLKIIIPNSKLNEMRITNMSYHSKTRSIHVSIPVSYETDMDFAKRVVQEAVISSPYSVPREGDRYSPVYFISIDSSSLGLATTVYYEPSRATEVVRDDINSRITKALADHHIEIPYNYLNVVMNNNRDA